MDGPHPGTGAPKSEKATKHRAGMSDPQARLRDMDEEGIDVALLFGTSVTLCVNGLQDGELAGALCQAINAWLAEYCAADRRRLRPVALLPCQDPPAAARMLEAAARQGAVAAMVPPNVYGIGTWASGDSTRSTRRRRRSGCRSACTRRPARTACTASPA